MAPRKRGKPLSRAARDVDMPLPPPPPKPPLTLWQEGMPVVYEEGFLTRAGRRLAVPNPRNISLLGASQAVGNTYTNNSLVPQEHPLVEGQPVAQDEAPAVAVAHLIEHEEPLVEGQPVAQDEAPAVAVAHLIEHEEPLVEGQPVAQDEAPAVAVAHLIEHEEPLVEGQPVAQDEAQAVAVAQSVVREQPHAQGQRVAQSQGQNRAEAQPPVQQHGPAQDQGGHVAQTQAIAQEQTVSSVPSLPSVSISETSGFSRTETVAGGGEVENSALQALDGPSMTCTAANSISPQVELRARLLAAALRRLDTAAVDLPLPPSVQASSEPASPSVDSIPHSGGSPSVQRQAREPVPPSIRIALFIKDSILAPWVHHLTRGFWTTEIAGLLEVEEAGGSASLPVYLLIRQALIMVDAVPDWEIYSHYELRVSRIPLSPTQVEALHDPEDGGWALGQLTSFLFHGDMTTRVPSVWPDPSTYTYCRDNALPLPFKWLFALTIGPQTIELDSESDREMDVEPSLSLTTQRHSSPDYEYFDLTAISSGSESSYAPAPRRRPVPPAAAPTASVAATTRVSVPTIAAVHRTQGSVPPTVATVPVAGSVVAAVPCPPAVAQTQAEQQVAVVATPSVAALVTATSSAGQIGVVEHAPVGLVASAAPVSGTSTASTTASVPLDNAYPDPLDLRSLTASVPNIDSLLATARLVVPPSEPAYTHYLRFRALQDILKHLGLTTPRSSVTISGRRIKALFVSPWTGLATGTHENKHTKYIKKVLGAYNKHRNNPALAFDIQVLRFFCDNTAAPPSISTGIAAEYIAATITERDLVHKAEAVLAIAAV